MKKLAWLAVLTAGLGLMLAPAVLAGEIKVGGIFDITGPTSDVGKDYGDGAVAA